MVNLYYIIILLLVNIIHTKIEEFSKIFSFDIINIAKKELDAIIDSDSTYIFQNNISQIKNLTINWESHDTLISTNLSNSILILPIKNTSEEEICTSGTSKLQIANSQFNFQSCGPNNYNFSQGEVKISHDFYQVFNITKSNCIIDYTSILSLPSFQKENVAMVIMDYIDNNLKIIENSTLDINETIFNESLKHMVKCNPTGSAFSCKIKYILFGMEGEKDDPFLAKKIEDDDAVAYFDNLSSYTIFPYEYLNYFLTSFFSKFNDDCEENEIEGSDLYYVTCSRKKIEIYSYARNMSVLINYISFPLKNLFDDSFQLLKKSSPDKIYFNIIFNKSSIDFIFGSHFFMGKQIGFNFLDNSTYIYSKEFIDFTSNFSGENSSTFEYLLYILTFGLFFCLLVLSAMMNWLHTRQVNKELANMLKN